MCTSAHIAIQIRNMFFFYPNFKTNVCLFSYYPSGVFSNGSCNPAMLVRHLQHGYMCTKMLTVITQSCTRKAVHPDCFASMAWLLITVLMSRFCFTGTFSFLSLQSVCRPDTLDRSPVCHTQNHMHTNDKFQPNVHVTRLCGSRSKKKTHAGLQIWIQSLLA